MATFPVYDKATSFDVVHKALREVPYFNQCVGSDGDGNCPQVFYLRKPHSPSDRCEACQIKRNREHRNKMRRKKRSETKKIVAKIQKKCFKKALREKEKKVCKNI